MNENEIRQKEYESKLRRDSRKLADKLYRAHKRQLVRTEATDSVTKLPTLKIDILPTVPEEETIDIDRIKDYMLTMLNTLRGLPVNVPVTTVGGILVHKKLGEAQSFDQIYIGSNGHVALRCESIFSRAGETKQFEMTGVITRLNLLLDLARQIYDIVDVTKHLTIRSELTDILDWSVNVVPDPSYDETSVAVLPRYVAEQEYEKVPSRRDNVSFNIAIDLSGKMLSQLGISAN